MGTMVSFRVFPGAVPAVRTEEAVQRACAELHRLEAIFTTWAPGSPMNRLRRGEISLRDAPPEITTVLELCEEAKELTGGWFDPWAMPGGVDPTGLVKGWAVERAAGLVQQSGAEAAIVNGGGDIAVFGRPPGEATWRAGVRHPWRPDAFACLVEVTSAIATSGCYERGLHLLNPRSGELVTHTASATVVGPSLALADALATGLAAGGRQALAVLAQCDGYEGYWVGADGSEEASAGMTFAC